MSWRMEQHPAAINLPHAAAAASQGGKGEQPMTPLGRKQQGGTHKCFPCWHSRSSSSTSSHGSRESSNDCSSKEESSSSSISSRGSTSSDSSSTEIRSIGLGPFPASALASATAATAAATAATAATAAIEPEAAAAAQASAGEDRAAGATEPRRRRGISSGLLQRLQRRSNHAAAGTAATRLLLHAASRSKPPPMPLQSVTMKFLDKEIEDLLLPAAAFSWALGYTPSNAKQQQQLIWCRGYAIARLLLQLCGEALLPLLLLSSCNRAGSTTTSRKRTHAPDSLETVLRHLVFVLFNLRLCLGLSDIPVQLLLLSLQQHAVEDVVLYGPFLLQLTAAALQQQQTPGQACLLFIIYISLFVLVVVGCILATAWHTVIQSPVRLLLLLLLLRSGVAFAGIGSYIHGLVLRVEDACSRHVFAASVLPYLLRLEAATCCSCCATAAAKKAATAAIAAASAVSRSSSESVNEHRKQQQQHPGKNQAQADGKEAPESPRRRQVSGGSRQEAVVATPRAAAALVGAAEAAAAPGGGVLAASAAASSDTPQARQQRQQTEDPPTRGAGLRLLEHQPQQYKPEGQQQHEQESLVEPQRRHSTGALSAFGRGAREGSAELAGEAAGEGVWSDVEHSPICRELKKAIATSRRTNDSNKWSSRSDEASSRAATSSNAAAAAAAAEEISRRPTRYVLLEGRRRSRGLQASHEHVAFAAGTPAVAEQNSTEAGKIKPGHPARINTSRATFSWRRCSGSSFSSLLQQSSKGQGVHALQKLSEGKASKALTPSSRRRSLPQQQLLSLPLPPPTSSHAAAAATAAEKSSRRRRRGLQTPTRACCVSRWCSSSSQRDACRLFSCVVAGFGAKTEAEISQQPQQRQRKTPLRRLLTRLHTLNSGPRHRSTKAEQTPPAAARGGLTQAAVVADSHAVQRATPSALMRAWQRSSSNSSSNLPSWLCEGPRMAGSIAKGPRESRQMRGLRLLHHLPRWMHASSSSSSNSRLWVDTAAASPATASAAAAAGGISPPSAARAPAAAAAANHIAFRFPPVGTRSAAAATTRNLGEPACGGCSRCSRLEEQSPHANSGRATAAATATHNWRCSDALCARCASHRQQQVASLQQQLQLHLPPARMPTDTIATAGTKLATPSSATGRVWLCVPSSADTWRYLETHDAQQQQQQQQHMHQQQQQQGLWPHRLDSANCTLTSGSPQLHKVVSVRHADSSLRSSSGLAPAAAAEGEETPSQKQRHDRARYIRHSSRSSSNGVVQIPLPSGKPSILQEGSLLSPAAEAGPTYELMVGNERQSSSNSPQQQRQVTPEVAAAARAAAAAAGAEWSRKASARLRPAAEGAAAVAQRAAAAALMAAAAEVQEGHTDSPQEGRISYSSHSVRDKLEKILWRIGV
ncbi:hypothetical protein ACSSS7_005294 [Eimeria intestinalis]